MLVKCIKFRPTYCQNVVSWILIGYMSCFLCLLQGSLCRGSWLVVWGSSCVLQKEETRDLLNVSMLIVINSVLSKFSFVLSYYSIPGMCNEKTVKYQANKMIVSFSVQIIYHIGCTLTMKCLIISKC